MPAPATASSCSAPPRHEPVVVVGTTAAASATIARLLDSGDAAPRVLGALLIDAAGSGVTWHHEVPILGDVEDLPDACAHLGVHTAIVTLPAAMSGALQRIREALRRGRIEARFMTPASDALTESAIAGLFSPPPLDLAWLIGREPHNLDEQPVRRMLAGKRVLITGAGGSIGSELARRCAALGAGELILMERSENALFEIDRQIGAMHPRLARRAVLHDIVDAEPTLRRFVALRPQIVFHAAAHKHVPMMEDHPAAAVNNNFFGTKSVADAARATDVERFVLISTDKAVNPTSIMGATKRLAEIYVRSLNRTSEDRRSTRFCLVRFGNVLGSACSVLPIWGAQIAEGGPLTITHPDMTRYFMTIPEAAALVIQSAAIESGEEVFVLDMGEPVRIRELAERFMRARGLEPVWGDAKDAPAINRPAHSVRVLFTGPRPGEKLHEQLAHAAEELVPTNVPGVLAWNGRQPAEHAIQSVLSSLSGVRQCDSQDVVIAALQRAMQQVEATACGRLSPSEAA